MARLFLFFIFLWFWLIDGLIECNTCTHLYLTTQNIFVIIFCDIWFLYSLCYLLTFWLQLWRFWSQVPQILIFVLWHLEIELIDNRFARIIIRFLVIKNVSIKIISKFLFTQFILLFLLYFFKLPLELLLFLIFFTLSLFNFLLLNHLLSKIFIKFMQFLILHSDGRSLEWDHLIITRFIFGIDWWWFSFFFAFDSMKVSTWSEQVTQTRFRWRLRFILFVLFTWLCLKKRKRKRKIKHL